MLVLSRQVNESIIVGEGDSEVEVMIVSIRGGQVRVGIRAPKTMPVHRREVRDEILAEGRALSREPRKSPDMDNARGDERAAG
jgi:carbon storage regulator